MATMNSTPFLEKLHDDALLGAIAQKQAIVTAAQAQLPGVNAYIHAGGHNLPVGSLSSDVYRQLQAFLEQLPADMKADLGALVTYLSVDPEIATSRANYDGFEICMSPADIGTYERFAKTLAHEFGHIKHYALLLCAPEFQQRLDTINKDIPGDRLRNGAYKRAGKHIWTDPDDIAEKRVTLFVDGNPSVITDSNKEEYYGRLAATGKMPEKAIIRLTYKNGIVISRDGIAGQFYYGPDDIPEEQMTPEQIDAYLHPILTPRFGFITPYSAKEFGTVAIIGGVLGIGKECRFNKEEISDILELHHANPQYMRQVLSEGINGDFVPIDANYDYCARYPLLRQKLRLMQEYCLLPELTAHLCASSKSQ
ncbi:hypothetical protein HY642_05435 [Candidatus Woesearchaeota archaeon]|nr:hypothetical protein [Candidatus Woesearchaeota archaeon]